MLTSAQIRKSRGAQANDLKTAFPGCNYLTQTCGELNPHTSYTTLHLFLNTYHFSVTQIFEFQILISIILMTNIQ
jgi:hypothetical protein